LRAFATPKRLRPRRRERAASAKRTPDEGNSSSTQFVFGDLGELCQMPQQSKDTARFTVDVVTAVNPEQLPAAALNHPRKFAAGDRPSYRDFEDALLAVRLRGRDIHRKAPFDRFMQIAHQLIHSLALCGAPRNGGDLGPKAALLCLMHHDLDFHDGAPMDRH
jgi:hypothetical protein